MGYVIAAHMHSLGYHRSVALHAFNGLRSLGWLAKVVWLVCSLGEDATPSHGAVEEETSQRVPLQQKNQADVGLMCEAIHTQGGIASPKHNESCISIHNDEMYSSAATTLVSPGIQHWK